MILNLRSFNYLKTKITVKVNKELEFTDKVIPIIAGPNGTENFLFKFAKFIKSKGLKILRGHAYKPLTFPYRSKQYKETMSEGMNWCDEVKIP